MLWQHLRQSAAQPAAWLKLARRYAGRGLPWQAGYAARQALRLDASLMPQLQPLELGAWQDATAGDALQGREALSRNKRLFSHPFLVSSGKIDINRLQIQLTRQLLHFPEQ